MPVVVVGHSDSCPSLPIPFFLDPVSAGFPSPAQDYVEQVLDLNSLCVRHPAATFFVRVQGDSMCDAGIYAADVLVVDRSLVARHGDTVIACVDGELTVKELCQRDGEVSLLARNSAYPPMTFTPPQELEVFGVVTGVVRTLR